MSETQNSDVFEYSDSVLMNVQNEDHDEVNNQC